MAFLSTKTCFPVTSPIAPVEKLHKTERPISNRSRTINVEGCRTFLENLNTSPRNHPRSPSPPPSSPSASVISDISIDDTPVMALGGRDLPMGPKQKPKFLDICDFLPLKSDEQELLLLTMYHEVLKKMYSSLLQTLKDINVNKRLSFGTIVALECLVLPAKLLLCRFLDSV